MKSDDVIYESCNYYANKGNEVVREFFEEKYNMFKLKFVEPEDNHSVYDLQMDIETKDGKTIHYYIEVKLKFNKHFFDDYTYITRKKVGEIKEFMEGKDKETDRFIYFNFYPMCSYVAMFNLTKPKDYDISFIENRNATANETDIEPYITKVAMAMLPMKNDEDFKMFRHSTDVEIRYNNRVWQHGRMI